MELPQVTVLGITRLEFSPDDMPVLLVALILHNGGDQARRCVLAMQARSQLMDSYPWSTSELSAETRNAHDNCRCSITTPPYSVQECSCLP